MSSDKAKKRQRHGADSDVATYPSENEQHGDDGAMTPEKMMAAMNAAMGRMQKEMDSMKLQSERTASSMRDEMARMKQRLSRVDELERKCEYLEARCDSLGRSLQMLATNQEWEYSAPDVPDNLWTSLIDRGMDDLQVASMQSFLFLIKDKTCDLRRGGDEFPYISIGCESMMPYDNLLLPHWKEFCDALQLCYHFKGSGCFHVENAQLPAEVLDMLAHSLKTKKFQMFGLCGKDFIVVRDGIAFARKVVRSNPMLRDFLWENNNIDTMENASWLLESLKDHPSLESVHLKDCCGNGIAGYDLLRSILSKNNNFSRIFLDSNNIRTLGGTHLPNFLATNPSLKRLDLENNHLDDNDAVLIAQALKQNTNLRRLALGGNDITELGCNALANAVYDPTSLNSAADSNHTCTINGLDGTLSGGVASRNAHGRGTQGPARNRQWKIYDILSERNEEVANVHHLDLEFGEDFLKHIPKILECVPRYSYPVIAPSVQHPVTVGTLSIMYEILRGWRMPELYEVGRIAS